jgi:hypothetical protein
VNLIVQFLLVLKFGFVERRVDFFMPLPDMLQACCLCSPSSAAGAEWLDHVSASRSGHYDE